MHCYGNKEKGKVKSLYISHKKFNNNFIHNLTNLYYTITWNKYQVTRLLCYLRYSMSANTYVKWNPNQTEWFSLFRIINLKLRRRRLTKSPGERGRRMHYYYYYNDCLKQKRWSIRKYLDIIYGKAKFVWRYLLKVWEL